MAIDRISELIAHFIGEFGLTDTEDRLRDQNDAFRYHSDGAEDFVAHNAPALLFRAPYEAVGHDPGLTPFWFSALPEVGLPYLPGIADIDTPAVRLSFYAPDPLHAGLEIRVSAASQLYNLGPPPPPSIVVIAHQFNVLSDNDLMWSDQSTTFTPLSFYQTQLADLVITAHSLSTAQIGDPLLVAADAPEFFDAITAEYAVLVDMAPPGAAVTVLTGAAVYGTTINGAAADEAPALSDLLPKYFQATEEDGTEEDAPHPFFDAATSAEIAADLFEVADGHAVIAGANMVINETVLVTKPVDADVIAVMGDVVSLSVISQVNVVQDINIGACEIAPTQAINAATFALQNSPAEILPPDDEVYDGLPVAWGVTRIDADVVCVNWMHQFNLITDNDRTEITFSGEDTYLNFGGNTALNQVSLLQIALAYDLIIIGGQMIDMSLIQQTNVLLDNDSVTYDGDWPASVSAGDNLVLNSAAITEIGANTYGAMTDVFADAGRALADGAVTISATLAHHALFAGTEYLSVLYIAGDLINVNAIEQTNILGDADQVAVELAALEDRPEEPDGPVTVTTGSNAVVNLATIFDNGLDSEILVGGEIYDDLLLYQANLIDTDDDPLDNEIAPLTSEAVAFLADDLIVEQGEDGTTFITPTDDGTVTTDVMQSMLA